MCARVGIDHPVGAVDEQDRLGRRLDEAAVPDPDLLPLALGEHPVGDVDAGASHACGRAVLVHHDLAVGGQVAHRPVGPHDPLDHLVGLAGGVGILVHPGDPLPVLGVDQGQEALVGGVEGSRLVPVDPEELVGPPVGVAGDVPVVVAHVRQVLRVVHPGGQVAQVLTGPDACQSSVQAGHGNPEARGQDRFGRRPPEDEDAVVPGQPVQDDVLDAGLQPGRRRSHGAQGLGAARFATRLHDEVLDIDVGDVEPGALVVGEVRRGLAVAANHGSCVGRGQRGDRRQCLGQHPGSIVRRGAHATEPEKVLHLGRVVHPRLLRSPAPIPEISCDCRTCARWAHSNVAARCGKLRLVRVVDGVHRRFLGARTGSVDAFVLGDQVLLDVLVGALVGRHQAA